MGNNESRNTNKRRLTTQRRRKSCQMLGLRTEQSVSRPRPFVEKRLLRLERGCKESNAQSWHATTTMSSCHFSALPSTESFCVCMHAMCMCPYMHNIIKIPVLYISTCSAPIIQSTSMYISLGRASEEGKCTRTPPHSYF